MKTFMLYWLDGSTNEVRGNDIASAMNNAGYGALGALDHYKLIESDRDKLVSALEDFRNSNDDVMECVCGYKEEKWKEDTFLQEGDRFEEIHGTFIIKDETGYGFHHKEVSLFACPKCNTVQMVVDWVIV